MSNLILFCIQTYVSRCIILVIFFLLFEIDGKLKVETYIQVPRNWNFGQIRFSHRQ